MSDTLNVQKREQTGSLRMKRLRQSGQIPAVLYGHGEGNVMLSVSAKELNKVIEHGAYVVKLQGAESEDVLIKDVQWDAFGLGVMHVDFTRVDPNEKVEVSLPIVLRGDAVGTHHGGVIDHHLVEVKILCPAKSVPEEIELNISELAFDQSFTVGELEIPDGAEFVDDTHIPVVSCIAPPEPETDEEAEPEAVGAEPELVGDEDSDDEAKPDGE